MGEDAQNIDWMTDKYRYKPYDPLSKDAFQRERRRLARVLGPSVRIHHIGSTAVPGLGGKGVIDIYIVVPAQSVSDVAAMLVSSCGYDFRPAASDARKRFLRTVRKDGSERSWMYHVHLTDEKDDRVYDAIRLRNYLIANPMEASRYDRLKQAASDSAMKEGLYEKQKRRYQRHKDAIVKELIRKSR